MSAPAVAMMFAETTAPNEALAAIEQKKRSLADMQSSESTVTHPSEFDDVVYRTEVLQLPTDKTEEAIDEGNYRAALDLGIDVSQDLQPEPFGDPMNSASTATMTSAHVRSSSTSRTSQSTDITAPSSNARHPFVPTKSVIPASPRSRGNTLRRSLSFTEYEKFLAQAQAQEVVATSIFTTPPPLPASPTILTPPSAPSIFSVSTRKSYFSIKRGIGRISRFGKPKAVAEEVKSCICCKDDFKKNKALHNLPCSHIYCDSCLRMLVTQAMQVEAKMPPKCCNKPIPAFIVKSVLDENQQQVFMKSVLQYATPSRERIYCPNILCGEFIPKRGKLNPKRPFDVDCPRCDTKVCKQCKKDAHAVGQDCPADWELDTVLQMGENHRWRRCYSCSSLVELTKGRAHMTCRCNAQFCYICGAMWDTVLGCPNNCNGEEQARQRKAAEEARRIQEAKDKAKQAALEYSTSAEAMAAVKRSRENQELTRLRVRQVEERDRFLAFEQKQKWALWTRHGQDKVHMIDSHVTQEQKMKDRHTRTLTTLEDRQVAAEMELRQTLKQERKACLIRLRHMEAYCDGLNSGNTSSGRIVTERDLRELGQQYNLRDDMERMHQSRINVLRDKQAQQLESLSIRQEEEYARLDKKLRAEAEGLEARFAREESQFEKLFETRRQRLNRRWSRVEEIKRKMLETFEGVPFGPLPAMEWPDGSQRNTSTVSAGGSASFLLI